MEITRGSPEAAGDLTQVSGVKLGLSQHVTEGGAVQEPYTVMADTGGGGLGRKRTKRKAEPCTQVKMESTERGKRGKRSRLLRTKYFISVQEAERG